MKSNIIANTLMVAKNRNMFVALVTFLSLSLTKDKNVTKATSIFLFLATIKVFALQRRDVWESCSLKQLANVVQLQITLYPEYECDRERLKMFLNETQTWICCIILKCLKVLIPPLSDTCCG